MWFMTHSSSPIHYETKPADSWLPTQKYWKKGTRKMDILKGKFHPKIKIPSLSIHRHADGKLDEIS